MQLPPGAAIVIWLPRSEKPTLVPAWRSASTPTTPLQLAGSLTGPPALLPAAATMTTPRAMISSTAAWYAALQVLPPPRLMLMTLAGLLLSGTPSMWMPAAQRMPAMMSESTPKHLPSTRTGSTRTPGAVPAMPVLLLAAAPIRLAVEVPCHELAESTALPLPAGSHL